MKPLPLTICTMFEQPCRHCSEETTYRAYSEFDRDPNTGLTKPIRQGKKWVVLGEFCNDAGKWIADMHFCPVTWGNYILAHTPAKKEVKKVMKEKEVKRKWKVRKDGDIKRTAEVLHVGQQTLKIV